MCARALARLCTLTHRNPPSYPRVIHRLFRCVCKRFTGGPGRRPLKCHSTVEETPLTGNGERRQDEPHDLCRVRVAEGKGGSRANRVAPKGAPVVEADGETVAGTNPERGANQESGSSDGEGTGRQGSRKDSELTGREVREDDASGPESPIHRSTAIDPIDGDVARRQ